MSRRLLRTAVKSAAVYDTAMGSAVDANGYTTLPLRPTVATRYFVGSGGSDAASGLAHATRLLTMAAAFGKITNYAAAGDQILLAEGSTFNEGLPFITGKGGFSALYPTVVSSYDPNDPTNAAKYGMGHQRGARPVLQVTSGAGTTSYFAVKGLDLNAGLTNTTYPTFSAIDYFLFENNLLRVSGLTFDSGTYPAFPPTHNRLIVRNNSIYGGYNGSGIYVSGINGVTIEDNVIYHPAWKIGASRDDPPGTGVGQGGPSIFSHSMYIQTDNDNFINRRNLIMDSGGDGGLYRAGGIISENLLIDNPNGLSLGGAGNSAAYAIDRPKGIEFQCCYNAIMGAPNFNTTTGYGTGVNSYNGVPGSRVFKNLWIAGNLPSSGSTGWGNQIPTGVNGAVQPSYALYDYNVMYGWVTNLTGAYLFVQADSNTPYVLTTYQNNRWDGPASGSNVNATASAVFPTPYTATQLYAALGFASKQTFIDYIIITPEAHLQRQARSLLFAGYAIS